MSSKLKWKELALYIFMVVAILLTTGFNYFSEGIMGGFDDLIYHMLRIEAVKEALETGGWPARVNPIFYNGYGYASSMFYPDIFLIIPAFLRMIGFSPTVSWKLFVLLLVYTAGTTTYLSFKYIVRNKYYAMSGTFLLMLSQYYIADLLQRSGLSEYISFIFLPILIVGIYDYVACEGKKIYLLGIAFVGMFLSHTIMTVIGLLVTIIVMAGMLFVPSRRKNMLVPKKIGRLIGTAIVAVLLVAYYVFPMFEQMFHDEYLYEEPWAQIGDYTQPLGVFFNSTGEFYYIAYIGIGIPILMLLTARVLLGKPQNKWADFFLFGGILIFVLTTDIVPWEIFNDTFLNMLQFTFRLYPYALCFVVLGLSLYMAEKCQENTKRIVAFIVIITVGFGIWQSNISSKSRYAVNEESLRSETFIIGRGEWLPVGVRRSVVKANEAREVIGTDSRLQFVQDGYLSYYFNKDTEVEDTYVLPLIYYKGYKAQMITAAGEVVEMDIARTEQGFVELNVGEGISGKVSVWYEGTTIQSVSNAISLITLLCVALYAIMRYKKISAKSKLGIDKV